MPIYEYACPDCGHKFELIQKFSDDPAKECPSCKAQNVKKLISLSAFQLTGSGWYKDHYGLKGGEAAKTDGGAPKTEAAKTEAAKPATTASTPAAAPASKPAVSS